MQVVDRMEEEEDVQAGSCRDKVGAQVLNSCVDYSVNCLTLHDHTLFCGFLYFDDGTSIIETVLIRLRIWGHYV